MTTATFRRPASVVEALELIARDQEETKFLAGGTGLVLMLSHGLIAPRTLLSLDRISSLAGIRLEADGLHVGAMTRLVDVARSPVVLERCPALADAAGRVGNVRIRNQATLGGNLAHADYASDPPTMLAALDARVTVAGRAGTRHLGITELVLGPYTTALEPGELITEIVVPQPGAARMAYLRLTSRGAEDRPCVSTGVLASFDATTCGRLRLVVGATYDAPRLVEAAEQIGLGTDLNDDVIDRIAGAAVDPPALLDDPRGSRWYRERVVRACVRRVLERVRVTRA